ncbi:hypothetical protein QSH57_004218 [Fusarium oxysporum f. sp. vasinfectum]|nr:hypothetical protein QSH57_004218 [Fusarium oxysporum f. sp. vasinfectum]
MSTTLRIREISLEPGKIASTSAFLGHWNTELNNYSKSAKLELRDPFSTLSSKGLPGLGPEETILWYFDKYCSTPFETAKSETAVTLLISYGRSLASQIATCPLLPKRGQLWIQIVTPQRTEKSPEVLGPSLQHLHWEVLEDVSIWPPGFTLDKVSIVRSLERAGGQISKPLNVYPWKTAHLARDYHSRLGTLGGESGVPRGISVADTVSSPIDRTFRILLVICRPDPEHDVDYQLVAKSLLSIVNHVSSTGRGERTTTLHILRPPTWDAFKEHLESLTSRYDLVHFDTRGKIQDDGSPALLFCKPNSSSNNPLSNPLRMKKDWKPAREVREVLENARVRNVVLNACDSASFRTSAPGSNLAELLLSESVRSVLAMVYKVNEEAVEIFTKVFYWSLLVDRTPVEEAAYHARLALLRNRSRRAPFMLRVELIDHIVPVLYSSNLRINNSTAECKPGEGILGAAERMIASVKAKAVSAVRWATGTNLPPALVGRDNALLLLETHLYIYHKVLLHGQGGVGKSELLRYACRFWKSTGWVKGAAYIDFDQQTPCPHKSMTDIARSIASQLRFDPGESSVEAVLNKLRNGKYLVVFDSAEVFNAKSSMAYENIRDNCSKDLEIHLSDFIDKATKPEKGSMVVVASRLDTTTISHVSSHHKHLLSGLSVISSVRLLQDLSFKPGQEVPHVLACRENIEMLRRAVILVEGNPVALRLLATELWLVKYDCEELFNKVLYGVCTTLQWPRLSGGSRFERSLALAYKLEPYPITRLAPFWNIIPKDLTMYHYFWSMFGKFDLEPEAWLSEDFWSTPTSKLGLISLLWPHVETRLIQGGILGHATVCKTSGDMSCYHVHPVFTLYSRAWISEELWRRARFAFVRAVRLWYSPNKLPPDPDWVHIMWDHCDQHEDHLYNWRVIALAWCVKDGNVMAESLFNKRSLFSYIYHLGAGIVPVTPRYSRLLVPHIRTYLSELYAVIDPLRPRQVPTDYDLSSILIYSYDLWKIETEVLNMKHTARAVTIDRALAVLARWKASPSKQGSPLPPGSELNHHQLLYAAAVTSLEGGDIKLAKARYEAHLAINPHTTTTVITYTAELQCIRFWYRYSLVGWAACVYILEMLSSSNPKRLRLEGARKLLDSLGLQTGKVKPGQFAEKLADALREMSGAELAQLTRMKFRDLFGISGEELDAVRRFGEFARAVLDEPAMNFLRELMQIQDIDFTALQGDTGPGIDTSASSQITEELGMEEIAKLLAGPLMKVKENQKDASNPLIRQQVFAMAQYDAMLRMFGGDTAGSEAAIRTELAKEALSSTTSTGAEQLANVYMMMYQFAVKQADEPDYKKGLKLLTEFRRHRPAEQLTLRNQSLLLAELATCYHGIGRVEDVVRVSIDLVQVVESLTPADCPQGDVKAAYCWVYKTVFEFEKLWVFLNPGVVSSAPACALGLTPIERLQIHQIMTEAKRRFVESYNGYSGFEQIKEVMDLLVAMV